MMMTQSVVQQSFTSILISIVTDFLTGILLGSFNHFFILLPGLLILVPASISMRGNIFASLGSRLGTALHLGSIEEMNLGDKLIKHNIYSTIYITSFMAIFLGIVSKITSAIFHIRAISSIEFISIAFLSGIISGVIMLFVTIFIAFKSYEHNYDPDNVTSPLITGLGDLFTLPAILFSGYIILKYKLVGFALFLIFFTISIMYIIFSKEKKDKNDIISQSIPILIVCSIISMVSGITMQSKINMLSSFPSILMMIPVFLEEGGNIGNIFASRLSTKLHIGSIEPRLSEITNLKDEFLISFKLWLYVFPLVGFLTYVISYAIKIKTLPLLQMILISSVSGFILSLSIILITFVFSAISYKKGIDPDNVSIPILTSIADAIGIIILLFVTSIVLLI